MPNWVHNSTKIIGDKKAVENCVASLEKEDEQGYPNVFDFETIEPMPEEVRNTEPDRILGGGPKNRNNWYDWSCDNWGTKWNSCNAEVNNRFDDGDNHVIEITYDTAWAAPVPVWDKLAKKFPKLEFRHKYDEEMQHFYGVAIYIDGKLDEQDSWEKEYDERWTNY